MRIEGLKLLPWFLRLDFTVGGFGKTLDFLGLICFYRVVSCRLNGLRLLFEFRPSYCFMMLIMSCTSLFFVILPSPLSYEWNDDVFWMAGGLLNFSIEFIDWASPIGPFLNLEELATDRLCTGLNKELLENGGYSDLSILETLALTNPPFYLFFISKLKNLIEDFNFVLDVGVSAFS